MPRAECANPRLRHSSMRHADRFLQLQRLLAAHEDFWRAAPFHEPRPPWTYAHAALAAEALALDEAVLESLAADPDVRAGNVHTRWLEGWLETHAEALATASQA